MKFTTSNWEDVRRYYEGTVIKLAEFGDRLFQVSSVSSTECVGTDEEGTRFELSFSDDFPYEITYVLPTKAVFQYKDNAYVLQRVPQRQYRRGICNENTRIVSVVNGGTSQWNMAMLKAFVTKQKYYTLTEAVNDKGKKKSFALNSRMSYVKESSEIKIDLTPIALYVHASNEVYLKYPQFQPELQKLLDGNNEAMKVTV